MQKMRSFFATWSTASKVNVVSLLDWGSLFVYCWQCSYMDLEGA